MFFTSLYITIPFTRLYIHPCDNTTVRVYKSFAIGTPFGFVIYSVYNLTLLSICNSCHVLISLNNTLWETFFNTMATVLFFILLDKKQSHPPQFPALLYDYP